MSSEGFQHLKEHCGHHCGMVTVGKAGTHVGHCWCVECHGVVKHEEKIDE